MRCRPGRGRGRPCAAGGAPGEHVSHGTVSGAARPNADSATPARDHPARASTYLTRLAEPSRAPKSAGLMTENRSIAASGIWHRPNCVSVGRGQPCSRLYARPHSNRDRGQQAALPGWDVCIRGG